MPEIQLGMHTIRSHGTRVARTHMHDWLILLLLVIIDAVLNLIQPFHRFVGEGMMTDLRYPLKANTIPFWAVPIIAILLPLAVFLVYYFIRKDVYDLHHAIMGLLFSVLITAVMTDAIKDAVGRPRPDFFWRCFPDGKGVFDPVTSNVLCTGDKGVIKEGHKSFPSGHTSWSFAGLVYLAWYLSGKLRAFDRRGHVAKLCLVFLPILVAAMIAVSRVDDYWHHWQDVFAGALIGMIIASFCYLQFFPPPYDVDGWGPHAYFQMLAESRNGAQPSTVNNEIHHVQSAELQAVSLYIPPQHDADTRGNSWDSSPMLGASQNIMDSAATENMISPSHVVAITNGDASSSLDSGHARLLELGYKQQLKRDLSAISNFSLSFSVLSVLTGITTLYNTGLNYGGPVSMQYGWFIASGFTMLVALSMAEICSSYPTSGGLYYWSAKLAGPTWAPFASWITGWFNIIGQWAGSTSVNFSLAQLIQVIILLSTGGKNGGGYEASKYVVIAFHGGILFLLGIINSLPISVISFLGQLGAIWNALGVFLLMILIPSVATERASVKFVFTHFNDKNDNGINSRPYIFLLGLLMSQYTLSGMAYAFSRDGAMPLSSLWHKVNKQEVPIYAVWLSVFISFCMALTSLGSIVAFEAMVSIAVIVLYIAYALPIIFRVTLAQKHFVPGPFNLGRYGIIIGWVSVLWVVFISILFSLPVSYPITIQTLNYTPVALGCLIILVVSYWILSARHWFKGPITNVKH
ncbi:hypothetical protein JHK86_056026 [Glycine max]|nr:hypothetical protein JHK86_056026 [Glycine max]